MMSLVIKELLEFLYGLMDIYLLDQLSRRVFKPRAGRKIRYVCILVLSFIIYGLGTVPYSSLIELVLMASMLVYIFYVYQGKWWQKVLVQLFLHLSSGVVTMLVVSLAMNLTGLSYVELEMSILPRTIMVLIIKSVLFALILLIQKQRLNQAIILERSRNILIYFGLSVVILLLSTEVLFLEQTAYSHVLIQILVMVYMLSLIIMMVLITRYYQSKARMIEIQASLEESSRRETRYAQEIQNQIEVMRFKHDLKNHFLSIQSLMKEQAYDKALDYVNQMEGHQSLKSYVSSANEVLNAILNAKIMNHPDIEFRVRFEAVTFNVSEWLLTTVLGNALDNAIEAVQQGPQDKRWIEINLSENASFGKCVLLNPYFHNPVTNSEGELLSHKRIGKKGFGLMNMRDALDKNEGLLDLSWDDHQFRCVLLFKLQK